MLKRRNEGTGGQNQLAKIAGIIANPNSTPVLTQMMLKRRCGRLESSAVRPEVNPARPMGSAAPAATSKRYAGLSGLWMNEPVKAISPAASNNSKYDAEQDEPTFQTAAEFEDSTTQITGETSGHVSTRTRLDLQTNNSKREGRRVGSSSAASVSESDYEIVSDVTDPISLENTSAVARGADAMVKNSFSRQTEIIDTSKLIEEGKVSTEYIEEPEIIEEQDHAMVDEYEKTFAYARQLRKLLNMNFKEVDKSSIETNFLLIKAHEHPTQRLIDRWRNVDYGVSYNDQVKRQKQLADYLAIAAKKKGKKGVQPEPVYPDLIRFSVRFRNNNSEKRWKDYLSYRQKMKKMAGNKGLGPMPKPNDKYVFAFQDIWSRSMVVFVKPTATVRDIIDPVFARLGLARRADFVYTVGCFNNDKRAGKAKILGVPTVPEEVEIYQSASELYKKNCTEIYVNDNRVEMFSIFPDYYIRDKADKPDKKDKKKKVKAPAAKNKSNSAPGASIAQLSKDENDNNSGVECAPPAVEEPGAELLSTPGSATRLLRYEADAFEASSSLAAAAAAAATAAAAAAAPVSPGSASRLCLTAVPEALQDCNYLP